MKDLPLATFTKYFAEAVHTCFSTQASVKLNLKPASSELAQGDLISTISFSSPDANGSVSLIFPTGVFLKIVNGMLGENETKISSANADAASELLNIVYGLARPKLNAHGFDFMPALPTVVVGNSLSVSKGKSGNDFIQEAATDAGLFYVTGNFTQREERKSA